ncbi:von Willebrand factor [Tanacetum coccineum]
MINSLVADGGTNIAEALKKESKVMTDRKFKNPVSGMILLSDGQDTCNNWGHLTLSNTGIPVHTFGTFNRGHSTLSNTFNNRGHLTLSNTGIPVHTFGTFNRGHSTLSNTCKNQGHLTLSNTGIPVHTFGFGADHDANLLHSISEQSGGMFSFIEAQNVIQDAFAQCIGGLLSVVVQELRVEVECVHPVLRLGSIKAGSHKVGMDSNGRWGFIEVGDLYAEEERDFLVSMDIPAVNDSNYEMPLVKFKVIYKDPIKNTFGTIEGNEVTILRPHTVLNRTASLDVVRQRNHLSVASAIADAHVAAENGNLEEARSMLGGCQRELLLLGSALGEDEKYGLDEELEEMREGMDNPIAYGSRGRASRNSIK